VGDRLSLNKVVVRFLRVPPPVERMSPLVLRYFLAAGIVVISVLMPVPSMYSSRVLLGVNRDLLATVFFLLRGAERGRGFGVPPHAILLGGYANLWLEVY